MEKKFISVEILFNETTNKYVARATHDPALEDKIFDKPSEALSFVADIFMQTSEALEIIGG